MSTKIEAVHMWEKTGKKSETEIIARVNGFVVFFLEGTDLNTKIGETAAENIKETGTLNE
ncbi:hypothetical protein EDC96DRAFT_577947 [Choanephora cucurbitarum]|nr:hypothetical protein EDC96DRAFT_577947 [Choanephora cucurbitarum]